MKQEARRKLDAAAWKTFAFEEIFVIERGASGIYQNDLKNGKFPYVSASAANNGSSHFISSKNRSGNLLSLAYDGSVGETFYQPFDWFASEKVVSLELKNHEMNKHIALFIATVIRNQKERFSYSYKWSVGRRMLKSRILLPMAPDGQPDYAFMEGYMRQMEARLVGRYMDRWRVV